MACKNAKGRLVEVGVATQLMLYKQSTSCTGFAADGAMLKASTAEVLQMSADTKGRLAFGVKPPHVEVNFAVEAMCWAIASSRRCYITIGNVASARRTRGTVVQSSWHRGAKLKPAL